MSPISERQCFRILQECSASFSKSLQGLDKMYSDGLDGFDKLNRILKENRNFEKDSVEKLKVLLKLCKNYLKFTFKSHLRFSTDCADHCVCFALDKKKICDTSI